MGQGLRCDVGSVIVSATRASSVLIARRGRRIGIEMLTKIGRVKQEAASAC